MTNGLKRSLRIELLENRDVPASLGAPWAAPLSITASFAPDGTGVQSDTSSLFAHLTDQGLGTTGREQILLAMQQWLSVANLNIGIVADTGLPFGKSGAGQGDTRFGDIRIGSASMNGDLLASTQLPDALAGTWAGDILVNENAQFSIGQVEGEYDLYTVFLQELGHALGLKNSTSTSSVMFDEYQTARLGLSSADVDAIQTLYGIRQHDAFDLMMRNETFGTASWITMPTGTFAVPQIGDLTVNSDVDFYRFSPSTSGWIDIKLGTNGMSLLTATLNLYSSTQSLLATRTAVDPLNGDLSIRFLAQAGQHYYLRVGANAASEFKVGAYRLTLVPDGVQSNPPADPIPEATSGINESFSTATNLSLQTTQNGAELKDVRYRAAIGAANDLDYYRFTVTNPAQVQGRSLTISVSNLDQSSFRPKVTFYNSSQQLIASKVIVNGDGTYTIQIPQALSVGTYFVKVERHPEATAVSTGGYQLHLDFNETLAELNTVVAQTTLTSVSPTRIGELTVAQDQLVAFHLAGDGVDPNKGVRLSIYNSAGTLIKTLTSFDEVGTLTLWLPVGTFRLVFEGINRNGTLTQGVAFNSKIKTLGDSIDPYEDDPNYDPPPPPPPNSTGPPSNSWYYVDLTPPPNPGGPT